MTDWLIDSSVAAKWILPEVDSQLALQIITDVNSQGGQLWLLDFALLEVTQVIWVRYHRRLLTLQEAEDALTLLQQVPFRLHSSLPLIQAAFTTAAQHDISVYDALFVAGTVDLGIKGVTADVPLVRAIGTTSPIIKLLKDWT